MQNVSQEWKDNQNNTLVSESDIEISLKMTDPDAYEDASATDNGKVFFADTNHIVSDGDKDIRPYATLETNQWLLDGSREIVPDGNYGEVGFVGSTLCTADKVYATNPIVTIGFTQVHTNLLQGVTIKWSDFLNEYAVEFVVTAYNGGSIVATKRVTDNTYVQSAVMFDISDYDKITIEVIKWSIPYRRARIDEVFIGVNKVFSKKDIFSYNCSHSVDPISAELPKSEVSFSIDNLGAEYNPYNVDGLSKYLIERQEINVRYGYKLSDGVEWISGGKYYISEWDAEQNGMSADFKARDLLEFMGGTYYKGLYNETGTSLYDLAEDVLLDADLPINSDGTVKWVIDERLKDIYTVAPLPIDTHANCLQMIANASECVFYQDRKGVLRLEYLPIKNDMRQRVKVGLSSKNILPYPYVADVMDAAVTASGVNLFDLKYMSENYKGNSASYTDNSMIFTGTDNGAYQMAYIPQNFHATGNITISGIGGWRILVRAYDSGGNCLKNTYPIKLVGGSGAYGYLDFYQGYYYDVAKDAEGNFALKLTIPDDVAYFQILFVLNKQTYTYTNFQVEVGHTASAYEGYNGTVHTPSADGTLEIPAITPTMTLTTNKHGVNIECEYYQGGKTGYSVVTTKGTVVRADNVLESLPAEYGITYFNSYSKSGLSLSKPLKQVDVPRYSYSTAAESTELFNGVVSVTGTTDVVLTYSGTATNVSAKVTGGTLNSATYYSNACVLNITAMGDVSIIVTGKSLETSSVIMSVISGGNGESVSIDNPLITSQERALAVGAWVETYMKKRMTLSSDWRADPRLDALDIVDNENDYGVNKVIMTNVEYSYNGAFKGSGEGRVI